MVKIIENNLVNAGLVREQKEANESFMKKMLMDLGVVLDGTFTFGTGITAFLPSVRELLQGGTPTLTEQDIVLLYITAMWILLKKNQDKIERALKIIREKGLTDLLAKVYDFLQSTEDIVIKMADQVGYTASRITDITAFTFMTFPILDVLSGLIRENTITIDNPGGYLKSILISIGILTIKNGFNSIIRRIKQKYGKIEERHLPKFTILKEYKEDDYYNKLTTSIVKDIMWSIKKTITDSDTKTIYLPEEINNELTYNNTPVSVEVTISRNEELPEEFLVESFYSPDDDVIELGLELNPLHEPNSYQKIYSFLIEYIRHELEHYIQNISGELPPPDEDLSNLEYYLQPHEIPAQVKGLNLRAKKTKKSYEEVVKDSVTHSQQRYGLSDSEADQLYNKLVDGIEYQLTKSSLQEQETPSGLKIKKVFENDDFEVIVPLNHESFCYYGKVGTTWCDEEYFYKRHLDQTPFILLNKKSKEKHVMFSGSKIALLVEPDTTWTLYNKNSSFLDVYRFLSEEPELQEFFKIKYNLQQMLKFNMSFSDKVMKEWSKKTPFGQVVYDIIFKREDVDKIYDYLGDDVEPVGGAYDGDIMVDIEPEGIELTIELPAWKEKFLDLSEDDDWYWGIAMESDHRDQYEEMDSEELNYMECWFNPETYNRLMVLFKNLNERTEDKCSGWDDGEMNELLERYFPKLWDVASWDILVEMGYGLGKHRAEEISRVVKADLALDFTDTYDGNIIFKNVLSSIIISYWWI